jgi:hypothetical protein
MYIGLKFISDAQYGVGPITLFATKGRKQKHNLINTINYITSQSFHPLEDKKETKHCYTLLC